MPRFAAFLDRRPAARERLFDASELAYARSQSNEIEVLAARFALKAAVRRVGGARPWCDIVVSRRPGGAPTVDGFLVSLTHTRSLVAAVAVPSP